MLQLFFSMFAIRCNISEVKLLPSSFDLQIWDFCAIKKIDWVSRAGILRRLVIAEIIKMQINTLLSYYQFSLNNNAFLSNICCYNNFTSCTYYFPKKTFRWSSKDLQFEEFVHYPHFYCLPRISIRYCTSFNNAEKIAARIIDSIEPLLNGNIINSWFRHHFRALIQFLKNFFFEFFFIETVSFYLSCQNCIFWNKETFIIDSKIKACMKKIAYGWSILSYLSILSEGFSCIVIFHEISIRYCCLDTDWWPESQWLLRLDKQICASLTFTFRKSITMQWE